MSNWQESFARDGYIHIPGFMDEAALQAIEQRIGDYLRDIAPSVPSTEIMFDDYDRPETLKRISKLNRDPYFAEIASSDKFKGLASALLNDAVVTQSMQYFNKPPGGNETPAHQDGYYFSLVPNEALTLWLALDDVDEANGAMQYVAGSHKLGVLEHTASNQIGFSQGLAERDLTKHGEVVTCRVQRGDLLVHHSLTIHYAFANTSERQRRVIGQVYFAERAKVDEEAKRRYTEALEKQRKELGIK